MTPVTESRLHYASQITLGDLISFIKDHGGDNNTLIYINTTWERNEVERDEPVKLSCVDGEFALEI